MALSLGTLTAPQWLRIFLDPRSRPTKNSAIESAASFGVMLSYMCWFEATWVITLSTTGLASPPACLSLRQAKAWQVMQFLLSPQTRLS